MKMKLSDTLSSPSTSGSALSRTFDIKYPIIRSDVKTFLLIEQFQFCIVSKIATLPLDKIWRKPHRNSYSMFASFLHVNGFARSMFSFKSFENIFAVVGDESRAMYR